MASYYEQLSLSPQASAPEIEAAIDALYNQWRQGVTHPDPAVVEEANRNLRVLEQMRATLTDPAKRAVYDAGLGLGGAAGLADPAAFIQPMAPPKPRRTVQTESGSAESIWACPKCQTLNPEWTQYCLKCGTMLVRRCPECGQMRSLVKTGVCGNCGMPYAAAEERSELKTYMSSLDESIKAHQLVIEELRDQALPPAQFKAPLLVLGVLGLVPAFLTVPLYGFNGIVSWVTLGSLALIAAALLMYSADKRKVQQANLGIQGLVSAEQSVISERQQNMQEAAAKYEALGRR